MPPEYKVAGSSPAGRTENKTNCLYKTPREIGGFLVFILSHTLSYNTIRRTQNGGHRNTIIFCRFCLYEKISINRFIGWGVFWANTVN